MYFLKTDETLPPLSFDIKKYKKPEPDEESKDKTIINYKSDKQEIIMFVGAPGSGKSTFWQNHLSDYVRVNNYLLKTKEKCLEACIEAINNGQSVVIDNTNPDKDTRAMYTNIAKEHNVPIRCFYFDCDKQLCMHNNQQRSVNQYRKHLSK